MNMGQFTDPLTFNLSYLAAVDLWLQGYILYVCMQRVYLMISWIDFISGLAVVCDLYFLPKQVEFMVQIQSKWCKLIQPNLPTLLLYIML